MVWIIIFLSALCLLTLYMAEDYKNRWLAEQTEHRETIEIYQELIEKCYRPKNDGEQ